MAQITYNYDLFAPIYDLPSSAVTIAASTNGYSYAAWASPDRAYVYGQLINSTGSRIGSPMLINVTADGNQYAPSAVGLTNGNIIVTFTDESVGVGGDIRGRLLNSAGQPIGVEIPIVIGASADRQSDVAALPGGGFVVTYTRDYGSGDLDVKAQRFDSSGVQVGSQINVSTTSVAISSSGSNVATLSNGGFVVIWTEYVVSDTSNQSVSFARFDANGNALGGPILIENDIISSPHVVGLADGGFAVAYVEYDRVKTHVYNSDGTSRHAEVYVSDSGESYRPAISTLPNGGFMVSYRSTSIDGTSFSIFTADGERVGDGGVILAAGGSSSDLVLLSNGNVGTVNTTTDGKIQMGTGEVSREIVGTDSSETLVGIDNLREFFSANAGNDTIDGGQGVDIARYSGYWRDYLVMPHPSGGYTVVDQNTSSYNEGADLLLNVEQMFFYENFEPFDIAQAVRDSPVVAAPIGTQVIPRGSFFSFAAGSYFTDADIPLGDQLTFTSNGLPAGISLNSQTGVISGTPIASGQSTVTIGAVDVHGAFVSQNFTFTVTGALTFTSPQLAINAFGSSAGGWANNQTYHRDVGDINGDGRADIVGFGADGTFVSLAQAGGGYGPMYLANNYFGAGSAGGGWSTDDRYHRELADVNGDGRDDIVGFGSDGVFVARGTASGGFMPMAQVTNSFGFSPNAGGWSSQNIYNRSLADVNGDRRADIVGFGSAGTFVALANAQGGFNPQALVSNQFGANASAGGWSSDTFFHRELADINGDGRDDIVGFGSAGTYVALATGGGNFGSMYLASNSFGTSPAAGGWSNQDIYVRHLADVNNDGRADIVGFGSAGTFVALANSQGGFGPQQLVLNQFGANQSAGGWSSDNLYPRMLADINGDGDADILGFSSAGVFTSQAGLV